MNYEDFTIRARDWKDGKFKVEVTGSPVDRMPEPEQVSYEEAVLAHPLRNLEHKRIRLPELIGLGEALADMLLPPEVRSMFLRSLEAVGPDQGLRLRLVLDEPQVADLPWEFVYLDRTGGEKTRDGFLALDRHISLARHVAIPIKPGSVAAARPLRIVVGLSAPSDAPPLDLGAERETIEAALEDVEGLEVDFVPKLTVEKLEEACQGAHLFHFAGHGQYDREHRHAAIVLEDAEGYAYPFPAENLAHTLGGAGVRVAFLGACESGRRGGENVWGGMAPALMPTGIPGAVGMQYQVYNNSATAFARRFYQSLAAGLSLDEAVFAGRSAVLNVGASDDVDWGVPALYMRSSDGVIFPEVANDPSLRPERDQIRVMIKQQVVIRIQAKVVQVPVYGGNVHQVQVYALSSPGRGADWRRFLDEKGPPYKYLQSYTARDRAIFKGRDSDIRDVIRQIGSQRLVVVRGEAGVGKTSLLEAGVIPQLMEDGALVVKIPDYTQPLETSIREGLVASPDQIPIPLPDGLALPDLVRNVCNETKGTLVLVLDQFEGLFEPNVDAEGRAGIIGSLAGALRAVEPEYLRLVIVLRADAYERLLEIKDQLPDSWSEPVVILPLNREQARLAIERPLDVLEYPVSYVPELVPSVLVPALDALTPDDPERITPAHLQIVCRWLYRSAATRRPPLIDDALYHELRGAEGIMASYMERTLETELSAERELAKQLMEAMAFPDLGPWVLPEQLPSNGHSPDQVRDVLDSLAGAELLVYRGVNGKREYAFASPIVTQGVRERADPALQRRYQALEDLERVWTGWLAHESLASRVQLGHLEGARTHLSKSAVKVLLLVRSAVAQNTPNNPWPAQLRGTDRGLELIRQLEEPEAPNLTWHGDPSTLNEAKRLLGLEDDDLPDQPGEIGGAFGPVAWSATSHPQPVTRQTAALALTALQPYPQAALDRLRWALRASAKGWQHWLRQGELRGTLADADPDIERLGTDLSLMDRLAMWWWRARRRLIRDRHRIFWLMVGGGIGGGLALGLLRAVLGALTGERVGVEFATNFWWGWMLGAALSLGITLAGPLLLGRFEKREGTPPIWRAPLHPDRRRAVLAVCLGTISFGLTHVVVAWFNGLSLSKAPLVAPLGFVAGLGLSLALHDQPRAGWHLGILRWLLRLTVAALAFVLAQAIFIIAGGPRPHSLPIVRSARYYYAEFFGFVEMRWPWLAVDCCTGWPSYLALIDAALVGVVLTVGIAAGLLLAQDWLKRWRALIDQRGD